MQFDTLEQKVWSTFKYSLPRLLTQLDRNQYSPGFGSFDRSFWHYKIRDFSSIILQQSSLFLFHLKNYSNPDNPFNNSNQLDHWIEGGLDFWVSSQLSSGSFNEYYPNESGYPPCAFSLYSFGLLIKERPEYLDKTRNTLRRAIEFLLNSFEEQALNQQAAGIAGLALANDLLQDEELKKRSEQVYARFFASQDEEGWFNEYDGQDIGYLSVTIDCLVDYYELTGEQRAFEAIKKSILFISYFVMKNDTTPVMVNSRNTNYIVPYGMVKMAHEIPEGGEVIRRLYSKIDSLEHFIHSIDDRYLSHYVHRSIIRSLPYLKDLPTDIKLPVDGEETTFFPNAGVLFHFSKKHSFVSAISKGGVSYLYDEHALLDQNFGYQLTLNQAKYSYATTHWQSPRYEYRQTSENEFVLEGMLTSQKLFVPTPLKHMVLRVLSTLFGRGIIPLLKKYLIFSSEDVDANFKRQIKIEEGKIVFDDHLTSKTHKTCFEASPYSLRHVASADSFTFEELKQDTVLKEISLPLKRKLEFRL